MLKASRSFLGSLRTRREDFVDRLAIRLFFFVTRRAPLPILWEFRRELRTAITERFIEEGEKVEGDEHATEVLSILCR